MSGTLNYVFALVFLVVAAAKSHGHNTVAVLVAGAGVFALLYIGDQIRELVKLRREERPVSHTYNVANK